MSLDAEGVEHKIIQGIVMALLTAGTRVNIRVGMVVLCARMRGPEWLILLTNDTYRFIHYIYSPNGGMLWILVS